MTPRKHAVAAAGFVAALTITLSCGGSDVTGPPLAGIGSVTLSQQAATIVPGATVTLAATVRDVSGAVVQAPVAWSTTDPLRATVSEFGVVTGVGPGPVTITATSQTREAHAAITVKEGAVVGGSGGSVNALSGRVDLAVPGGAVGSPLMVTVEVAANPPPDARLVPGTAIELGPTGQAFNTPVQLRIRYDAGQLPVGVSETDLRIHRAVGGLWQLVPGGADPGTRTVSASLSSFSQYAVLSAGQVPSISLSSTSLQYNVVQNGANPPSQLITITNGGGGTLSGLSIGSIAYGAGATGWLQMPTLSGSTASPSVTLTVQPVTGALAPGTYTATVPIQSSVAVNSPQNLMVTMTIVQQPAIGLSSVSLNYAAAPGGANPASQVITITNDGAGTLSGLNIGTITYGAGATGWLQAPTLSGSAANPSVTLTVQPVTGALSEGTYTATIPVQSPAASNSPRTITVTLTITANPAIVLSSSGLTYSAAQNGANPASQLITITNGGGGTLSGLSIGTISYGAGATAWLQAPTLSSATANPSVTLTVQPVTGALAPGTYTATVPVQSPVAANGPQNLTITFTVVAAPAIALSSADLSYSAVQGAANPASQFITVTNSGGGTLSGLGIGTITYGAGATGWLQAPTLSGTTANPSVTLTVQPATGALALGTYTATIPVQSSLASNTPRNLTITFTITGGPAIALSSPGISYAAVQAGVNPASQSITITNGGGGALSGLNIGAITYGAGATGWLQAPTLSATSATPSVTLTVQPVTGSLAPGTYTASIPIQSPVATNSPRVLGVTFTVTPLPSGGPSTIVYQRTGATGAALKIWKMDPDGGNQTQVSPVSTEFEGQPDISPDGSKLVFEATRSGTRGIYVMNGDGTGAAQLFSLGGTGTLFNIFVSPRWSPDGAMIAHDLPLNGNNDRYIRIMSSTGQLIRVLDASSSTARDFGASWSSAGNEIVVRRLAKAENGTLRSDIARLSTGGGVGTLLTGPPSNHNDPAWSPNGNLVAFSANTSGSSQIHLLNLTTSQITQLTNSGSNGSPTWSPDGTKIAFVRSGVADSDIWTMDLNGSNQTNITNSAGIDESRPDWGVRLPVVTAPQISVAPSTLTFNANQGGANPASQSVNITNVGGGTLSGVAVGTITYSAGATGWLQMPALSGSSAPATLSVQPVTSGLAAGAYTATIPIISGVASNSPQNITVTFTVAQVAGGPAITLSSNSLNFSATQGGANPSLQSINITNSGTGALTGLNVGAVTYGPGASGWLQASRLSGTTAGPVILQVLPLTGTLPPGTYTATIPVQSPVATNGVQNLSVSFTLTPGARCSVSGAPVITVGQTIGGSLASTDCLLPTGPRADVYTFSVGATTDVQIDVTTTAFAAGLNIIDASTGVVVADGHTGVQNARLTRRLTPGSYVIEVRGNSPSSAGAYQLSAITAPVAIPFDGSWLGADAMGNTVSFKVQLNRVIFFFIDLGRLDDGINSCYGTIFTSASADIAGNAFALNWTPSVPVNAAVSGSLSSAVAASGNYGTITLNNYVCAAAPGFEWDAIMSGRTWSAARNNFIVSGSGGADLQVDAMAAPATGAIGGTINIAMTAGNHGTVASGAFQVGFYFSTDQTITTADTPSGSVCSFPLGLSAGVFSQCAGPITVPGTLAGGTYFVGAIVDDLAQVSENDETNNTRASSTATVLSSTPGPDLTFDVVTAPATGTIGSTISVSGTVRNQGTLPAGAFRVAFYYSTDANITTADVFSGSACTFTAGLAPGAIICSGSINVPGTLAPGSYFVGAIVDDMAQVAELNETNNAAANVLTTLLSMSAGMIGSSGRR